MIGRGFADDYLTFVSSFCDMRRHTASRLAVTGIDGLARHDSVTTESKKMRKLQKTMTRMSEPQMRTRVGGSVDALLQRGLIHRLLAEH